VTALDDLTRNYRTAFLAYVARREEGRLLRGYELGRAAVAEELSLLDLARVHHEVLLEVLRDTPMNELPVVATAATEFLMEVLAIPDMAHRGFLESREPAR
jgi:Phosphoserine phosphatase RsbU, N-terminal domain